MELRLDTGLTIKSQEMPNGYLRVYSRIGKANQPLRYVNADGSTRTEIIEPHYLFSPETRDSFKVVPYTLGHPKESLNSDNTQNYIKGSTGNTVVIDGDFLGIVGTVFQKDCIEAIKSGKASEVSPGYFTQLDPNRGDGSASNPYFQMGRQANHVAAVSRGRHGSDVAFNVDAIDNSNIWIAEPDLDIFRVDTDSDYIDTLLKFDGNSETPLKKTTVDLTNHLRGNFMPTSIPVGKRVFNVDGDDAQRLAAEVARLLTRIDSLQSDLSKVETEISDTKVELSNSKAEASRLDGELTVTKTKLEAAEKASESRADDDEIAAQMAERLELWTAVLPTIRKDAAEFKVNYTLDSADIQRTYLLSLDNEWAKNEKFNSDDAFVAGLYEGLKPSGETTEETERADQESISNSLLDSITNARVSTDESDIKSDRVDGATYVSGGKQKQDLIAKRRADRSKMSPTEAMKYNGSTK